jgi:hypothetical protein
MDTMVVPQEIFGDRRCGRSRNGQGKNFIEVQALEVIVKCNQMTAMLSRARHRTYVRAHAGSERHAAAAAATVARG